MFSDQSDDQKHIHLSFKFYSSFRMVNNQEIVEVNDKKKKSAIFNFKLIQLFFSQAPVLFLFNNKLRQIGNLEKTFDS